MTTWPGMTAGPPPPPRNPPDRSLFPSAPRGHTLADVVYQNCRPNPTTMMTRRTWRIAALVLGALAPLNLAAIAASAQTPAPAGDPAAAFDKREVMVPMRDGVKLHTLIFTPKTMTENLPVIL